MSSLLTLATLIIVSILSSRVEAKKRLRSQTPTLTPTPQPFLPSHVSKCSQEGPLTLINVFLNPPRPRQGDKVTLSVFYYAPVEVEDPDLVFAFQLADKTFIHKSSLCANKLSKQEIHARGLDEEQVPQDDDSKPITDDNEDARLPPPCRIRVGEHMDNIDLTWLYASATQPQEVTMLYGHEKTPLICAILEQTLRQ